MYVIEVNGKTILAKFTDMYPECEFLISDQEQLHPLICLKSHCHRAANCMEKLVKRVKHLFDAFPKAELLILYFRYKNDPGIKGGVFWKDLSEPRLIPVNSFAWKKIKSLGTVYTWDLPGELNIIQ